MLARQSISESPGNDNWPPACLLAQHKPNVLTSAGLEGSHPSPDDNWWPHSKCHQPCLFPSIYLPPSHCIQFQTSNNSHFTYRTNQFHKLEFENKTNLTCPVITVLTVTLQTKLFTNTINFTSTKYQDKFLCDSQSCI